MSSLPVVSLCRRISTSESRSLFGPYERHTPACAVGYTPSRCSVGRQQAVPTSHHNPQRRPTWAASSRKRLLDTKAPFPGECLVAVGVRLVAGHVGITTSRVGASAGLLAVGIPPFSVAIVALVAIVAIAGLVGASLDSVARTVCRKLDPAGRLAVDDGALATTTAAMFDPGIAVGLLSAGVSSAPSACALPPSACARPSSSCVSSSASCLVLPPLSLSPQPLPCLAASASSLAASAWAQATPSPTCPSPAAALAGRASAASAVAMPAPPAYVASTTALAAASPTLPDAAADASRPAARHGRGRRSPRCGRVPRRARRRVASAAAIPGGGASPGRHRRGRRRQGRRLPLH